MKKSKSIKLVSWIWLRIWAVILAMVFIQAAESPAGLPELAEMKAAAERGDAQAQDRLAYQYEWRGDMATAELWYGKAAAQGIANAQYHFGTLLLRRAKDWTGKIKAPKIAEEAIRWYFKAARQKQPNALIDLGDFCAQGFLLKKDNVEAFKWYAVAQQDTSYRYVAKGKLDNLLLNMSRQEIEEGQRRANLYLAAKEPVPSSPWERLRLAGISGPEKRRLATINGHTFAAGEEAIVKIDGREVLIRCVEIRPNSVIVQIDGQSEARELKL
ncbi:MAG TPA: hypothetical protein VHH73_12825 [Verrucomicrobiae bacterium]|nr:hypothetical protein [Verrucomicrobiae bacterium]